MEFEKAGNKAFTQRLCFFNFTHNANITLRRSDPFIFLDRGRFFSTRHPIMKAVRNERHVSRKQQRLTKLFLCVSSRQTLSRDKRDAEYKNKNPKGNMWQSIADQLG